MSIKSVTSSSRRDVAIDTRDNREQVAVATGAGGWGWLPALGFIGALGLLEEALAMQLALRNVPFASALFWLGLFLLFVPVTIRLAMPQVSRRERIALVAWLGLGLYAVKVLRDPAGFVFHDEFAHWRTASDILQTARLFSANPLQGISALYPGLEIVTAALASISGLSIFAAGMLVIGAARLLGTLALYLLYEEISQSGRVAGMATVLSMAYPNFLFWSSQFAYESLALPLATLTLYVALAGIRRGDRLLGLKLVAVLLLGAVVITHHLTSYVLVALLAGIFVVTRYQSRVAARLVRSEPTGAGSLPAVQDQLSLQSQPGNSSAWGGLALLALVMSLTWLVFVARQTVDYLGPHVQAAARGVNQLVTHQQATKALFVATNPALATPGWERLIAFASVLLVLIGLPFGLLELWRRYRASAVALVLAAATVIYPLSLFLRLAPSGTEISNRSWDFLFMALGFVLAAGAAHLWLGRSREASRAPLFAVYAAVLFAGAVVVGMPVWARLPGPYLVGGDTRGLQAESYAGGQWADRVLGPDNRMIADSTNALVMGSYGQQSVLEGLSWIFFSPYLRPADELKTILQRNVQYIVVDRRVTTDLPRTGVYYEGGEPQAGEHVTPMNPKLLAKFDGEACFSRIYDSGNIAVYSVGAACSGR